MSKTQIYLIGVAVIAMIIGWMAYSKAPTPEPVTEPAVLEEIKPVVEKNNCPDIIRLYERLELERKVLGNDYITDELRRAYHRCF